MPLWQNSSKGRVRIFSLLESRCDTRTAESQSPEQKYHRFSHNVQIERIYH